MPNFDLPKYVRYKPQISSAQRLALKKKKNHDTCKKVCNTRIYNPCYKMPKAQTSFSF